MSVLTEYLRGEAAHLRAEAEQRRIAKLDWQRAVREIVALMHGWLDEADPDHLMRVSRGEFGVENYELGSYTMAGLTIVLGRACVRIVADDLDVVGVIQLPGETTHRAIDGRIVFDNGIERVSLYRLKDDDQDVWVWWTYGGVARPFDRESFEATVVGLLR